MSYVHPLDALRKYKQFLVWKLVDSSPKPIKLPLHPSTLQAHSAHDPECWVTWQEAEKIANNIGLGVGFVFTDKDPFYFVDIDNCLEENGGWSSLAIEICSRLYGAAVEISQSGTGLHIIGSGQAPPHACKNTELNIELYTSMRFAALGHSPIGDASYENSDALKWLVDTYFKAEYRDSSKNSEWTEEPDPAWSGPEDDEELIKRALASKQAGSIFGTKASFSDLWFKNDVRLAEAYPDHNQYRLFDYSSADAALLSMLAFWTGKDCGRMERLFTGSKLCRDKWLDRDDYRKRSILYAVSNCKNVYKDPKSQNLSPEYDVRSHSAYEKETVVLNDTISALPNFGTDILTPEDQRTLFNGCVYVQSEHAVYTPSGDTLDAQRFKVQYGGFTYVLSNTQKITTRNAWEAFTLNHSVRFPRVHTVRMVPDMETGGIGFKGDQSFVNIFQKPVFKRKKGDASFFINHIKNLLPNGEDALILTSYFAAMAQYPGTKFRWAPLVQGAQGIGKSTIGRILVNMIGDKYFHSPPSNDLSNNFNKWLYKKLIVIVEEVAFGDKRDVTDAIKQMISDGSISMTPKGVDQHMADNVANFVLFTNHKWAIAKNRNERRYCIFYAKQQSEEELFNDGMDTGYFLELNKWLDNGGYEITTDYLLDFNIPDKYNPATECIRAPETTSTAEAIEVTRGLVEDMVFEFIQEESSGFRGGWVSSTGLERALKGRNMQNRISQYRRSEILNQLGYIKHPHLRDGRVPTVLVEEGGKRPRLYIKKGSGLENLTTTSDIIAGYLKDQGYHR